MKRSVLILSICLLYLSFSSFAQKPVATPAKGYYAIGNNAAKLYTPTNVQVFTGIRAIKGATSPAVNKGYYATGNNAAKLPEQVALKEINPIGKASIMTKPAKGYYSIGRNAEKLQK